MACVHRVVGVQMGNSSVDGSSVQTTQAVVGCLLTRLSAVSFSLETEKGGGAKSRSRCEFLALESCATSRSYSTSI